MIYDEHGHVIKDDHSSVDKIKCECCGNLYPRGASKCPFCGHRTEYEEKHHDFMVALFVTIAGIIIISIFG